MKKVLFLLVFCLFLGLVACGKDKSEEQVSIVGRWNAVEIYLDGEKIPNTNQKYYFYFEEDKSGKLVTVMNQTEMALEFTWDENNKSFVVTYEDMSLNFKIIDLTKDTLKLEQTYEGYLQTFICNRYDEEAEKKKYIGIWEAELHVSQSQIEVVTDSETSMKFHLNEDGTGLLEIVSQSVSVNHDLTWEVDDYECNITVGISISLSSKYVATRYEDTLEIKDPYSKTNYYICKKQGQVSNVLTNEEKFIGKWYAGYYVSSNEGIYLKDVGQYMSFELNSNGTGKMSIRTDLLDKNETYDLNWFVKNNYCYIVVKTETSSEQIYVAKLYGDILRLYDEYNLTNYYYLCGKITEKYPQKFIGLWKANYLINGSDVFQIDGNGLEVTLQLNSDGTGLYNYIGYNERESIEFMWYIENGLCYITIADQNSKIEKHVIEIFGNELRIYNLENLKEYYICKK